MADYVITPANVKKQSGAVITHLIAGETLTAGDVIAISTTDGKAYLLDDADATVDAIAGMALNDAGIDQPIDIIQDGYVDVGVVATAGDVAVASIAVSGALAPYGDLVATNLVQVLGFFETTSLLKVKITNVGVVKG